jgi:hypothetical protein
MAHLGKWGATRKKKFKIKKLRHKKAQVLNAWAFS